MAGLVTAVESVTYYAPCPACHQPATWRQINPRGIRIQCACGDTDATATFIAAVEEGVT